MATYTRNVVTTVIDFAKICNRFKLGIFRIMYSHNEKRGDKLC